MKSVIKRILSWKTTLVGVIIILVTAYFVNAGKATFSEVWIAWAFALYFIFSNDPKKASKKLEA